MEGTVEGVMDGTKVGIGVVVTVPVDPTIEYTEFDQLPPHNSPLAHKTVQEHS
jgi:hypothetical protein